MTQLEGGAAGWPAATGTPGRNCGDVFTAEGAEIWTGWTG